MTQPSIALFLPARNEALNLPFVVGEAAAYLRERGGLYQIIIVNDGSTDNTDEVARDLISAFPEGTIKLVAHARNMGYGAALRTGLNAGLETGFDWICLCDGDGQFKVSEMGDLIDTATAKNADVAIGFRQGRAKTDGLKRYLMGRGWHFVSRLVLGYHAIDTDCGFKAFSRPALEVIYPQLVGNYATISPEILTRIHRQGFEIEEVPVTHLARRFGEQSGAEFGVVWGSFKGLLSIWAQVHFPHAVQVFFRALETSTRKVSS